MFELINPTSFKYYLLFSIIYSTALVYFIVAEVLIHKLNKKHKQVKKFLRGTAGWALFYAISGGILLFSRYAYIYFLSMEFLHILIAIITATAVIPEIIKLYKTTKKTE